jgi:hypothetical protein
MPRATSSPRPISSRASQARTPTPSSGPCWTASGPPWRPAPVRRPGGTAPHGHPGLAGGEGDGRALGARHRGRSLRQPPAPGLAACSATRPSSTAWARISTATCAARTCRTHPTPTTPTSTRACPPAPSARRARRRCGPPPAPRSTTSFISWPGRTAPTTSAAPCANTTTRSSSTSGADAPSPLAHINAGLNRLEAGAARTHGHGHQVPAGRN